MKPADALFPDLLTLHGLLRERGLWHALAYGTLLGAVRDGDLIPWDDDLDFLARPEDAPALLALALEPHGLSIQAIHYPARALAVRPRGLRRFDAAVLRVLRGKRKVADFFLFTRFNDGVARRYDLNAEVYWSPHSSFPSYFMERTVEVSLRGQPFPAPIHPERWLEIVYGQGWRVPRRSRALGGLSQRGRNIYGHRVAPHVRRDLTWCRKQGWDRPEPGLPEWPRLVRGAGPIGPTPRTEGNSRALWWRDIDELVRFY